MNGDKQKIDTRIQVITPENIAFEYRIAGPFQRVWAYLIDLCLRLMLVFAFGMLALLFEWLVSAGIGNGMMFIGLFIVVFFYGGLFETIWSGQTPGKWAMGMRVVTIDGQPISGAQAILRNLMRGADILPLGYQVGLISAAMTPRFQRLGDLVSQTMVVIEQPRQLQGLIPMQDPTVIRLAEDLPPKLELSPSCRRALSSYIARREAFNWPRRVEIARHLADPLKDRYDLPEALNPDLLLCAVYYKLYLSEASPRKQTALPATLLTDSETVAAPEEEVAGT